MARRSTMYAPLTLLACAVLTVGSSCSADVSPPHPDAEQLTSIGDTPDPTTQGIVRAFVTLLTVIQQHPTTTDPLFFNRGGIVYTPADPHLQEHREKPQIALARELETARDGTETDNLNRLSIDASAPSGKGYFFCDIHLTLRFAQLSPMVQGDLTVNGALAALRKGPANSITVDEAQVSFESVLHDSAGLESFSQSALRHDYQSGEFVVDDGRATPKPISPEETQKMMDGLRGATDCVERAFSAQTAAGMPNDQQLAPICSRCIVTGLVVAPRQTRLRVLTAVGADVSKPQAHIVLVDQAWHILWRYDSMAWRELDLLQVPGDSTGNIFVRYNPGRYDGVVILGIRGDSVHTYGTLPTDEGAPYGNYAGRFYDASVVDVDHNGVLDIAVHDGFCQISCPTDKIFRWNGSDYVNN